MGSPAAQSNSSVSHQHGVDIGVPMPHYQRGPALAEYARVCRMNCTGEVQNLAREVLASSTCTDTQRAYARKALAYTEGKYKDYMMRFESGELTDAQRLEEAIRAGESVCRELERYVPQAKLPGAKVIDQRFREFENTRARSNPLHFSQSVRGGHFVDLPENWKVSTPGGSTVSADISGGRRRFYISNLKAGSEFTITAQDFTFTAKLVPSGDGKSFHAEKAIGLPSHAVSTGVSAPQATKPGAVAAVPTAKPASAATKPSAPVSQPHTPAGPLAVYPPLRTNETDRETLKGAAKEFATKLITDNAKSGFHRNDSLNVPTDVAQRNKVVEPFAVTLEGRTSYVFPRRFHDREPKQDVSGILLVHHRDMTPSLSVVKAALDKECIAAAYKQLAVGKISIETWMTPREAPEMEFSLRSDGSVVVRKVSAPVRGRIYSPIFGTDGALSWKFKDAEQGEDGRYYPIAAK